MIFGRTAIGVTPTALALDTRHTSVVTPLRAELLSKVTVYLDGQGSGVGPQVARAVIYDAAGNLFAESAEVVVLDGQAAGWVDFSFDGTVYLGKPMPVQTYRVGVHAGGATSSIRLYTAPAALENLVPNPSAETTIDGTPTASSTTPVNLITNPSFEVDTAGWAGTGATIARSTAFAGSGAACAALTCTAAGNASARNNSRFPVTAGLAYSAGAVFRPGSTLRSVVVYVDFYDAGGLRIGLSGGGPVPEVAGVFTRAIAENRVAPVGAVTAQVICEIASQVVGEVHYVDSVIAVRAATVPAYFDGDDPKYRWTGTAHASTSAPALATYARDNAVWAKAGSYSRRHRVIRSDAAAITFIGASTPSSAGGAPVTPGRYYGARVSAYVEKMDTAIWSLRARIYWFKADGNASAVLSTSQGSAVTPALAVATDFYVVGLAPSDAAFAAVRLTFAGDPGGVSSEYITHGDAFALFDLGTGVKPVEGASLAADVPAYFDGDTAGYLWRGAAHASQSIEALHALSIADAYADGAAAAVGAGANAGLLAAFVTGSLAWDYPVGAIDSIFARYGWEDSQIKLGESGVMEAEGVSGSCGWHGTLLDPELGAFAVVREDGPMAALVGERLQVVDETSGRACYVYCHTDGPVIEDISLTRRAFQALSLAGDDELEVTAMPLGPVVSLV
jgi:hypothetical protein